MSRINNLIKELCPNGVKYSTIESVIESYSSGLNPRQNFKLNEYGADLYYVTVKEMTTGKIVFSDKTDRITKDAWNKIQNRSKLEINDILFSGIGTIGKVALVDIPVDNWNCSESVIILKPRINMILPKYLVHLLRSSNVQEQWANQSVGSTLKGLRKDNVLKTKIALPPLEVQEEIVKILDKFGELEAELEARKNQYEFWHGKLLNDGNELIKLKEICTYSNDRISYDKLNEDNYVGVDNLLQNKKGKTKSYHVPTSGNSTKFEKNDILVGNIRPYLRKIWFADCYGGTNGDVLDIRVNDAKKIYPRFLYYVLSSEAFFEYNNSNSKGAKMPRGDKQAIMNYEFAVPSIEKQIHIANVLDQFDKLVNNISDGLPAEIEFIRQQYEYYRNKLLSFEEL